MIKIIVDNEKVEIEQSFSCKEAMSDTIAFILDRIIIDEYIKSSDKIMSLSTDEQCQIIIAERKKVLAMMEKHDIETSYITSSETTSILEREVKEFCCHDFYEVIVE